MKYGFQHALGYLILILVYSPVVMAATSLKEIQDLANQGKVQQALEKTNELLASDPGNIEGRFYKGLLLTRSNKLDQAESVFTSLIKDHPDLPEPYNNLAVVYAAQGEYDKARDLLSQAINTHPSYATAHENLGDIYAKMASRAYNQVLELDDNNESAREKLSLVNELFSHPEQARKQVVEKKQETMVAVVVDEPPTQKSGKEVIVVEEVVEEIVERPPQPQVKETPVQLPAPVVAPEPFVDHSPAVLSALNDWAAAWSAQDVDAYLSHYSASYKPAKGLTRSQWEAQRKIRLAKPKFIKVTLSSEKVAMKDDKNAEVLFTQSYQSDTYNDRVRKNVLFTLENNRWVIAEEKSN